MKLFNIFVVQSGEELCVAARTSDHAAEVFVTFWLSRTAEAPGEFHVGRGAPEAFKDDVAAQLAARGNVSGVLVRQADGSTLFEQAIG